jgi:predicted TIM-barrel fold metal-dependent hydrolase
VRVIAIEEHFSTSLYRQKAPAVEFKNVFIAGLSEQIGVDIVEELHDIGPSRVKHMDAHGIDMQVLSFTAPGPQGFFPAAETIALARDANDRLAEAMKAHPGRFAGFAALPTAAPDAAADELERCVKQLGFVGTMIHGHNQGSFLDDKKYWVIFERAQALGVPIYLHPNNPHPLAMKAYFEGFEDISRAGWGYAVDTSVHFLRLLFAGVFDAFPKLQIILGHLGEGLPFAMHRLNHHTRWAAKHRGLKRTPLEYIRDHLYVTTSGNWFEPAFVCTLLALGAERIIFAVDWPYEPMRAGMEFLDRLSVSDLDREKITHLNAERLLNIQPKA